MFDNYLTWLCIGFFTMCSIAIYTDNKINIEKEKTKQIEIQLKVEMLKSGITNFPKIKLD